MDPVNAPRTATNTTASASDATPHLFYTELARWWPLISPVEDYLEEANEFASLIHNALPAAKTLLELGSGGGHNAFHMKQRFQMTLSDLNPAMLGVSLSINAECEHVPGDMRSLDLGRQFDAVFVHDAIDYMLTEADLSAAVATMFRHCRPGGVALVVPDALQESFASSTECGGTDAPTGEGVRYLEWSYLATSPGGVTTTATQYTFITRSADGSVAHFNEEHTFGLFPRELWLRVIGEQGFVPEVVTERTDEDRAPRALFLCRRP